MAATLRTAIVVSRHLSPGQAANVAAILMGQASRQRAELYSRTPPVDMCGIVHAGIRFSTVVLTASPGQISRTLVELGRSPELTVIAFTELGQSLNNSHDAYVETVTRAQTGQLNPVGLAISGPDELVRGSTRRFTLLL